MQRLLYVTKFTLLFIPLCILAILYVPLETYRSIKAELDTPNT